MRTRVISALIMLPLLAFLIVGGIPLLVLCLAFSVIGMWEFYKGFEKIGIKPYIFSGCALILVWYTIIFICSRENTFALFIDAPLWLFYVVLVSLLLILADSEHSIFNGPATGLGVLYIGFFLSHIPLIAFFEGKKYLWLCFLSAFGADTFAYFGGFFYGEHPMAPVLSPKKTWEGALFGLFGSTLLCFLFGLIFAREVLLPISIIGVLGGVLSQLGDLTASAFKRKMGIKDYGNLIPGHGGIMDRFDSVCFTAPLVFYILLFSL